MAKVIATAVQKGGCGKTTTTHTLGVGLGMKGYKILLVDADAQCNLSSVSDIDISNNKTLYEVMKGEVEPQDAIHHTKYYDIISGSLNMARADTEFTKEPYIMNCFYLMKEQIDKVKDNYDFVFIDTPPALSITTQNALVCCDSILVPTQADSFCINGLANLKSQIDLIKQRTTNKALKIEGILLTKYSERTRLNQILRDELFKVASLLETKVYRYAVRESVAVRESQTLKSCVLIENAQNIASIDYQCFINEFEEDNRKSVKENE